MIIKTIRDVVAEQETLRRRSYGVIEAVNGKLVRIQLRPWPKIASLLEAHWIQSMKSKRHQSDVCRLFYNQPMSHRNFLALSYIESSLNTSLPTLFATLDVLDQIAYIKRSDALIAEVSNKRITDRALRRWGWERYVEHKPKRHWIKRFYGTYPELATKLLRPNYDAVIKDFIASQDEQQASGTTATMANLTKISNVHGASDRVDELPANHRI